MIQERLKKLRQEMKKEGVDCYVVPTSDFHASEYVGEYFKARKYISGFTGSAGTVVITNVEAGLWTDGRYFIQADNQLKNTGVDLYKMGEEGVPSVEQFVKDKLPEGGCIGFDGRVVSALFGEELNQLAMGKNGHLLVDQDLAGRIWEERPEISCEPAYVLEVEYAGKTALDKISDVREEMGKKDAGVHVLTSLDDIAWLYNIRGNDIAHFPVVLSFAVLTMEDSVWFVNEAVLTDRVRLHLQENKIIVKPYEAIYEFLAAVDKNEKVMLDKSVVNYRIFHSLDDLVLVENQKNPAQRMKAVKNACEIKNTKNAHIKDGVAVTKFMYWLKNTIGVEKITEISASDYLEERRKEQDGFIELSFETISAYGSNAAMMHYSASEDSNAVLEAEGFLLVDSGGHYYEGSTDITRSIVLGSLSEKQKLHFTVVARSNLNLAAANFLYGCVGANLDILSRGPLWDMGIDYRCGTGHGIGYLLNVHEGPNGFRWKVVPERNDSALFEEGMITTDEPGVYLEGEYGIRTENELLCVKGEKNEYGQFMHFETITYAPIDLDGILVGEMTGREKKLLNAYHKMVFEKISPFLTKEEVDWLAVYTREI